MNSEYDSHKIRIHRRQSAVLLTQASVVVQELAFRRRAPLAMRPHKVAISLRIAFCFDGSHFVRDRTTVSARGEILADIYLMRMNQPRIKGPPTIRLRHPKLTY